MGISVVNAPTARESNGAVHIAAASLPRISRTLVLHLVPRTTYINRMRDRNLQYPISSGKSSASLYILSEALFRDR